MKRGRSSVLASMAVAVLLCASSILPASAATRTIRLAISSVRDQPSDASAWVEFQHYLNKRLEVDDCRIEFVERDPESTLFDLMHPNARDTSHAIQGAILSPFRYVVADLRVKDLKLVARMRRVGVVIVKSNERPKHSDPLDSYHSVVLMGQKASDRWPPRDTDTVEVSISDYRSTSEYVFPFAYFSDNGLLPKVKALSPSRSVAKEDAWRIPESSPSPAPPDYQHVADVGYRNQLEQVKNPRGSVHVISISDDKFNAYLPKKEDQANYLELFRSDDIPFDALVIRQDVVSDSDIDAIGRAFCSTREMSNSERDQCFPWIPKLLENEGNQEEKFWERGLDIHDFVECKDDDYDVVRAAAAKAFGGRVVTIAISRGRVGRVHHGSKDLSYFREWMKKVLRRTVDSDSGPVFIAVQPEDSDYDILLGELEHGRVDGAELNAWFAARAIGRETGALIGKAIFDEQDNYQFVMLAADLPSDPARINKKLKFAFTSEDSSSGYQYPLAMLKQKGLYPASGSRVIGKNADGVVTLLLNKIEQSAPSADYGFLSSFEWTDIQRHRRAPGFTKIKEVTLDSVETTIPNAYLVFSRSSASDYDSIGVRSGPRAIPTASQNVTAVAREKTGFPDVDDSSSRLPALNASVIEPVRANLFAKRDPGFDGYKKTSKQDVDELHGLYNRYGHDPVHAGLLMLIALVGFLGVALGFSFKWRGRDPETELSIQSLSDVLKGVSPQDREAQQVVTLGVKQLSALQNRTGLFTKMFGEGQLQQLQSDLQSSLLALLAFHNPTRVTLNDGSYSQELANLQKATFKTDNKLREFRDIQRDLDPAQQQQISGDLRAIDSVIEMSNRIITTTK